MQELEVGIKKKGLFYGFESNQTVGCSNFAVKKNRVPANTNRDPRFFIKLVKAKRNQFKEKQNPIKVFNFVEKARERNTFTSERMIDRLANRFKRKAVTQQAQQQAEIHESNSNSDESSHILSSERTLTCNVEEHNSFLIYSQQISDHVL